MTLTTIQKAHTPRLRPVHCDFYYTLSLFTALDPLDFLSLGLQSVSGGCFPRFLRASEVRLTTLLTMDVSSNCCFPLYCETQMLMHPVRAEKYSSSGALRCIRLAHMYLLLYVKKNLYIHTHACKHTTTKTHFILMV